MNNGEVNEWKIGEDEKERSRGGGGIWRDLKLPGFLTVFFFFFFKLREVWLDSGPILDLYILK